jgi:hypothetical protein
MAGCGDIADIDGRCIEALGDGSHDIDREAIWQGEGNCGGSGCGITYYLRRGHDLCRRCSREKRLFCAPRPRSIGNDPPCIAGNLGDGINRGFSYVRSMVWCITAAAKRTNVFDSPALWIASGALFSSPTAYFFSTMQPGRDQFSWISLWSFFLMVGAISGLTAWLFRYRKVG